MKVPRRLSQTVAFTFLALVNGCDRPTVYAEGGSPTGALTFLLETSDEGVTGFCFDVATARMEPVEHRCVDLEETTQPSLLLPDARLTHRLAESYLVLPPGDYAIRATPMDADQPSSSCRPSEWTPVTIRSGETTEAYLVSQCQSPDHGGLDIVTRLNHAPTINQLSYHPSMRVETCQPLEVTVSAVDPDGDPLTYTWVEIDQCLVPEKCVERRENGQVLSFESCAGCEFVFEVAVCDPFGLCATERVPIEVVYSSSSGRTTSGRRQCRR
jgi:hypothetical protein